MRSPPRTRTRTHRPRRVGAPSAHQAAPAPNAAVGAQRTAAHAALGLQQSLGNRAVGEILVRSAAPPQVMRHSSWEHTLIGDTPPSRLGKAAVSAKEKGHLLSNEWARIQAFSLDPKVDPRARFPDYRWLQLRGSGLWITYGEMNALADYLPDPSTVDSLPEAQIVPVLQRMRQGMLGAIKEAVGFPGGSMKGAATSGLDLVPGMGAAGEVSALDAATAGLGINRYQGLLARNACHFAPMSWQRWALYHNQAREEALAYNGGMCRAAPIEDHIEVTAQEHMRQAWLNNGYADHFLQDSFAAGHLVNKTLVMQWFAEYLADLPLFHWSRLLTPFTPWAQERPVVGVPSKDQLQAMTEAAQPGVAGRQLYNASLSKMTSAADRLKGMSPIDPQTAQERTTPEGRIAGSGVVANRHGSEAENYQTYLDMLNSSYLNLAAGAAHDYFNERGLAVANDRGDTMHIGGDDTMLKEGVAGQLGTELTAEAAHLSQQAIAELLQDGKTSITPETIFELVPKFVWVSSGGGFVKMPLEQWQDAVVKQLCFDTIFPDVVDSLRSNVRFISSELVSSGISVDQD